jgi:hypothetical protein
MPDFGILTGVPWSKIKHGLIGKDPPRWYDPRFENNELILPATSCCRFAKLYLVAGVILEAMDYF